MERIEIGQVVQHFKRETVDCTKPENKNLYLYRVLNIAEHTETKEKLVIYQPLYDNDELGVHFGVYARPYEMFMSEVEHSKYPNIKQKYRFEPYNPASSQ